jgi:RsiW-degrading membrane proteinase PrsW (M82 family)
MKIKFLTFLLSFFVFVANAQTLDTISTIKTQNKISYKPFIIPVALVTGGFLLKGSETNQKLQRNIRSFFGNDFHTKMDNYIQLVPIAQIYLGKTFGFKPKNDFQHQTINIVVANLIMGTTVYAMKYGFKEERPDQSNNLSFPSGHTATAFTNASLLFYEYKDSNLWYASSGFLFAAATGALRIANNKHYTSDVVTGAGIGLASGVLVSYWNPFKSMNFGKKKKSTAYVFPQIGNQIGLGALVNLN